MQQKKDAETTKDDIRKDESNPENMQENNATGANQNEQGQASFFTGSTTGGGSNFGQGSSHLGGGSYQQGSKVNSGANYNNEGDRLGNSATGTSNEGSSSANKGAAQSGNSEDAAQPGSSETTTTDFKPAAEVKLNDDVKGAHSNDDSSKPTSLERDSGLA